MKFIYNEAEALRALDSYERSIKRRDRIAVAGIASTLIGTLIIVMGTFIKDAPGFAAFAAGGVLTLAGIAVLVCMSECAPEEPPAVIFHRASQKGKVLGTKIKKLDRGWHSNVPYVFVQIELPDGTVEDIELCHAEYKQSTKYSETTFDVNKGIVFTPYRKELN